LNSQRSAEEKGGWGGGPFFTEKAKEQKGRVCNRQTKSEGERVPKRTWGAWVEGPHKDEATALSPVLPTPLRKAHVKKRGGDIDKEGGINRGFGEGLDGGEGGKKESPAC